VGSNPTFGTLAQETTHNPPMNAVENSYRHHAVKEKIMDGKRRINPQNPARQIRGRKLKKHLRTPVALTATTPAATTAPTAESAGK
jgi:hypothetical protein